MNKIFRKLRSRSGETLTEMLVSIVILGLSIAMMVTMIITSTHLTEQSSAKDRNYQDQLTAAEAQTDANLIEDVDNSFHVTIKRTDSGTPVDNTEVDIPVYIYGLKDPDDGSTDGVLKSYKGKK